jgi:dTDP-glucose 4,6-dehydratase
MRRPRAVITGGAGFLGSHLCERLLLHGYEVPCVDNLVTGTEANLFPLREVGPLQVYFENAYECPPIPGAIDLVVHLASPASPADCDSHR